MEYYIASSLFGVGCGLTTVSKFIYTSNINMLRAAEKQCIDIQQGDTSLASPGAFVFASGPIINDLPLEDSELKIVFPRNVVLAKRNVETRLEEKETKKWISITDPDVDKVDFLVSDKLFMSTGLSLGKLRFNKGFIDKWSSLFLSEKLQLSIDKVKDAPGFFSRDITNIENENRFFSEKVRPSIDNKIKSVENGSLLYKLDRNVKHNDVRISYKGKELKNMSVLGKLSNDSVEPYNFEGQTFHLMKFEELTKEGIFKKMQSDAYYSHVRRILFGCLLIGSGIGLGGYSFVRSRKE